jgi:hypothetical protein
MRERVRSRQYVMTHHARIEMSDDGISIYDVEHAVLTGEILNRQQDQLTGEWKYRLLGTTINGPAVELIAKFGPTGKLVIITVYAL